MKHDHDHKHDHKHDEEQKLAHDRSHDDCCSSEVATTTIVRENSSTKKTIVTIFTVTNMDCADEIKAIQDSLAIDGVIKISANLMSSTVEVTYAEEVSTELIKQRIELSGVRIVNAADDAHSSLRNRTFLVASSGLGVALGLGINSLGFASWSTAIYLISIGLAGYLILPKAISSLRRLALDMNILMSIAVVGAICIGEFSEAAAVTFLFALSELLESFSVRRARKAIQEIFKLTPQTALQKAKDGAFHEVLVSLIKVGDILRIAPGDRIALDGKIVSGFSHVNEAPLTGESKPVDKNTGANVFAGTINMEGSLELEVTKGFQDTKISKIIKMVEEAQGSRAPAQKFVDKFAAIYTPAVLVIALAVLLLPPLFFAGNWQEWLYRALVLLVVACPCALVISTPVAIVSGLTALAKQGVLVKGGAYLELLGKIRTIAVDKTGTLTEGRPKVIKVHKFNGYTENQIVQAAASLEERSNHPLAKAIVEYAKSQKVVPSEVARFISKDGRGVEAIVNDHDYFLGNHRYAHELGVCSPEVESYLSEQESKSYSAIVVGHKPHADCKGEVMGVISIGDTLRQDAKSALLLLRKVGINRIVLISGDNNKAAQAIGAEVGVDESIGDLLPEDKAHYIKELKEKYGFVAMVGDGVNDAPALANASVGIAMGAMGSDAAIETADIALMKDELSRLAIAVELGKRVMKTIQFNITFALATKLLFLVLAGFGMASLWLAVATDMGASLLVIANSLRLLSATEER